MHLTSSIVRFLEVIKYSVSFLQEISFFTYELDELEEYGELLVSL
jgi:hypothetical protein